MRVHGLTVGYVTGGAFSSQLIEWRSAGGPSHATTLVEPGYVIDAQFSGGVAKRPVESFAGMEVKWFRVPALDRDVRATLEALHSQLGKPYDWRDIVDFAFPSNFRRAWNDTREWICSELQIWAEQRGRIVPKLQVTANRLAPADSLLVNSTLGAVLLPGPLMA